MQTLQALPVSVPVPMYASAYRMTEFEGLEIPDTLTPLFEFCIEYPAIKDAIARRFDGTELRPQVALDLINHWHDTILLLDRIAHDIEMCETEVWHVVEDYTPPPGWADRKLITTTRIAHYRHAVKLAEQKSDKLRGGYRLPFAQVAKDTGINPRVVSHWATKTTGARINSNYHRLMQYYGADIESGILWLLPDGTWQPYSREAKIENTIVKG